MTLKTPKIIEIFTSRGCSRIKSIIMGDSLLRILQTNVRSQATAKHGDLAKTVAPAIGRALSSLFFDAYTEAIDSIQADPAIYAATIIPNLEALALLCYDQVKILRATYLAEDHVANLELFVLRRCNGAQISRLNLSSHRVSARSKLNGFTLLQFLDVKCSPAHDHSMRPPYEASHFQSEGGGG